MSAAEPVDLQRIDDLLALIVKSANSPKVVDRLARQCRGLIHGDQVFFNDPNDPRSTVVVPHG